MVLVTQFPEAILHIIASKPGDVSARGRARWDNQPVVAEGTLRNEIPIEDIDTDQITGLWSVFLSKIPAKSPVYVKFVSTVDTAAGLYNDWAIQKGGKLSSDNLLWYITAIFQVGDENSLVTDTLILPLRYDRQRRTVTAEKPRHSNEVRDQRIVIHNGRGFRIPGYFRTKGYVFTEMGAEKALHSPILFERLTGMNVEVGLLGNSLTPGYLISLTDSVEKPLNH